MENKVSVIVPVYCCAPCLWQLYLRLKKTFEKIDVPFEIILINDDSPDDSWTVIATLSQLDNRVKGVKLSKNFGQHYAITAGLKYATGEWMVIMDCDLQDQPEELEKFYAKALQGYDFVQGQRVVRQDSWLKRTSSKLFYSIFSFLTDIKQDETISNFGIYSRKVITVYNEMKENKKFFPAMIKWTGFQGTAINIEHSERNYGKSSYSLKRLVRLAFDAIISFSDKPLRLTAKLGIIISGSAFLLTLYQVVQYLAGNRTLLGWTSLMASIWFLAGLIIFLLGVIGLYIGRIYDEVKQRPVFIVDEAIGFDEGRHSDE